jgi:hypothetical protein
MLRRRSQAVQPIWSWSGSWGARRRRAAQIFTVERLEQRALLAAKPVAMIAGTDISGVHSRLGMTTSRSRFEAGIDLVEQGRIRSPSLSPGLSNLGARRALKPLAISVANARPSASNPLDEVVVHTQPGSRVSLKERGVTVQTAVVGQTGAVV